MHAVNVVCLLCVFHPTFPSVVIGLGLGTCSLPQLRHLKLEWCDFENYELPPEFLKVAEPLNQCSFQRCHLFLLSWATGARASAQTGFSAPVGNI